MSTGKERYCICRSTDGGGAMICCEKCDGWFHYKCVSMTKAKANQIELYYCPECIDKEPDLKIIYKTPKDEFKKLPKIPKNDQSKKIVDKKVVTANKQPQLRQTQQQTSREDLPKAPKKPTLTKRQKPGPKGKSKGQHHRKQCNNPECRYEARPESIYCSDECGLEFNRKRYEKYFKPKMILRDNSAGKQERLKLWGSLESEKSAVIKKINELKISKEELRRTIKTIKTEASEQYKRKNPREKHPDQDQEAVGEENEDILSGDASKTYCITCGCTIPANQALKHWSSCHKKNEDNYTYVADKTMDYNNDETEDKEPELRCNISVEKGNKSKIKLYCMNMRSACPLHSNWNAAKEEVCGCPLSVMQKLVPDGNYCTELKKDCVQHYHWDRFRIATIDMERLHLFTKLDTINERLRLADKALIDAFGGVVGLMWHNTSVHDTEIEVKVD